jgi:hypothetical protein
MHGAGVSTVSRLVYASDDLSDAAPEVVRERKGDGTVHAASLEACRRWAGARGDARVTETVYAGLNHTALLFDRDVLEDVARFAGELLDQPVRPVGGVPGA